MSDTSGNLKCYSIIICGQVQGVGYRYFALRAAAQLKVRGWVRNSRDGSVEIECEGKEDALKAFMARLEKGPAYSRVTSIETREKPYQGVYSGFSIEY